MAKNILICDDAAFMRMMIKDILTKNGYNIVGEAENGAKAVEKYAELKPDLVLMDITMPEMDGIEALKKIKAADANASIIMCSAMGQQAMVIESIQSGAKDFIVKPFQADRVLEAVQKKLGGLQFFTYG
jgi:two-component system chemotaxis response regulator CheY